jgi:hypothetical protein
MSQPDIFDDDAPWAEWLPELRVLFAAYNPMLLDERYTDTPDTPSRGMRSYLRIATYYQGRAWRAAAEIHTVLEYGLDDPDVVEALASMASTRVPEGRTLEDCLKMMVPHLVAFTEAGERTEPGIPESSWEWRQLLPNLQNLLGGYFHQDSGAEYPPTDGSPDNDAAVADYFATNWDDEAAAVVSEIDELLAMGFEDQPLMAITRALGCGLLPPRGLSQAAWLSAISSQLRQSLDAAGYQPPPGANPAYPPHDKRAWA